MTQRPPAHVEGITAFYVSATAGTRFVPVYRLVSTAAGRHDYTISSAERASLAASGWVDEGIHFYAAAN